MKDTGIRLQPTVSTVDSTCTGTLVYCTGSYSYRGKG
jgi:hypothetical protein